MQHAMIWLAWLLLCSTSLYAAETGPTGEAPLLPPELATITARALEQAASPVTAASELLLQEQLGQLDHGSAGTIQRWLTWYQQQHPYDRARYLSGVLGSGWSIEKNNSFWMAQAQALYQDSHMHDAERALRGMHEPISQADRGKRQSLLGLALMAQGRYTDALDELENRQGFPRSGLYDHYNFGVALVGQGRKFEGMALLDELGQTTVGTGTENHALLDRANLAVGWSWLAAQQGGTARAFFKRVGLDSPHSGMALLGLGWAELAPDGKSQEARFKRELHCEEMRSPPVSVSMLLISPNLFCRPGKKPATFRYRHLFAYIPGAKGPVRFQRALRPWLVLNQREAHDPAVQEAALAIGYAYDRLGDYHRAETAYRDAVQRYELELRRLDALETALRTSGNDAWATIERQARPDEFIQVRSGSRSGRILANLEALRQGTQELQDIQARLERYRPSGEMQGQRLEQLRDRWRRQDAALAVNRRVLNDSLRMICLEDVAERRGRLKQYLARAVLGLGVLYDRHGGSLGPASR